MTTWHVLSYGWNALWLLLGAHHCAACNDPLDDGYRHGPLCPSCFAVCEPAPPAGPELPHQAPPCHSAFVYEGPLAHALQRLKWQGRDDLAGPLGTLLAPVLLTVAADHDWLVPVPLHVQRLRERGFNQSTLLARSALRALGQRPKPRLRMDLLAATRETAPARQLGRQARFAKTHRLYAVPPRAASVVAGRRVILLDDVITTGATVTACAVALRDAGAAQVTAVSLLRVVRE